MVRQKAMSVWRVFAILIVGLSQAVAWADDDDPVPPAVVTGAPGVSTAIAVGATITGTVASGTTGTVACPVVAPVPALLTQVNSCSNISSVTRPTVVSDMGTTRPACDSLADPAYQELVQANIRAYALMNSRRQMIAQRMTCLLGVPVSEAQITDGLGQLSNLLCDTTGSANRNFVIDCGSSGAGATASYGGGLPYEPGRVTDQFCGSLRFRGDAIARIRDQERNVRGMSMSGPTYQQAVTQLEFLKQDFVDTIVHENTHALSSLLARQIPNASMSNPPNRTCSVGPMVRQYSAGCRFFDGQRDTALTMRLGTPAFDRGHYRPYATTEVINESIPRLEREIRSGRRAAERIRTASASRALTPAEIINLEGYDSRVRSLARFRAEMPCAAAADADPNGFMYQDIDQPTGGCGAIPSGTYRNEAAARAVARDITGGGSCPASRTAIFGARGTP